jgi:hypothetical protein
MTISEYTKKYKERLDSLDEVISKELAKRQYDLLDLQKDQLLYGRDRLGEILTPTYTEDPYFKSRKQAEFYRDKKRKLQGEHDAKIKNKKLYPKKGDNTPNLIVTGTLFHDTIRLSVGGDRVIINSGGVGSDIERKYGDVLGMSPESKVVIWNKYLRKAILRRMKNV